MRLSADTETPRRKTLTSGRAYVKAFETPSVSVFAGRSYRRNSGKARRSSSPISINYGTEVPFDGVVTWLEGEAGTERQRVISLAP